MATISRILDANVNGATYTATANDILEALDTCHSGATAPSNEVSNGKLWLDTSVSPALLKIYDNASWNPIYKGSGNLSVGGTLTATTVSATNVSGTLSGDGTNVTNVNATLLDGLNSTDFYSANNPAGYTTNVGDITGVTAGGGLSGGGSSGTPTISHADTSAQGSVNNSGTTFIQDITLDTYGHITGINSSTVSVTPTTSQVASATAGVGTGAVGSYGFFMRLTGNEVPPGTVVSASILRWGGVFHTSVSTGNAPAGSWRCMGQATKPTVSDYQYQTLYLRVS